MKVEKAKFDAMLGKLLKAAPVKNEELKIGRKRKPAKKKAK